MGKSSLTTCRKVPTLKRIRGASGRSPLPQRDGVDNVPGGAAVPFQIQRE